MKPMQRNRQRRQRHDLIALRQRSRLLAMVAAVCDKYGFEDQLATLPEWLDQQLDLADEVVIDSLAASIDFSDDDDQSGSSVRA